MTASVLGKNTWVVMENNDLKRIAVPDLQAPYHIKWYEPGDRDKWLEVQTAAEKYVEINEDLYRETFEGGTLSLAERQCFLMCDSDPVGTGTAWSADHEGQEIGELHWVAVRPSHQGLGLSKPLTATLCNRLVDLGHRKAFLITSTKRFAAISLYYKFGFKPVIEGEEERVLWAELVRLIEAGHRHLPDHRSRTCQASVR
jgi:ribosomal protein S18 acetylase RimI-like enzyme